MFNKTSKTFIVFATLSLLSCSNFANADEPFCLDNTHKHVKACANIDPEISEFAYYEVDAKGNIVSHWSNIKGKTKDEVMQMINEDCIKLQNFSLSTKILNFKITPKYEYDKRHGHNLADEEW